MKRRRRVTREGKRVKVAESASQEGGGEGEMGRGEDLGSDG